MVSSGVGREFAGESVAFVIIDVASGETMRVNPLACAERSAPCSTFKIWNTLIGLQAGVIASADEPFYRWDGQPKMLEAWQRDLTLREAFAASCVPAFQTLAERIGGERMQAGLDRIDYGDRDMSAGLTTFWLPTAGRKTILISPDEQAALLVRLVRGELAVSAETMAVLREVMRIRSTDRGVLYGKTGTGSLAGGADRVAWFVGWVESRSDGRVRVFTCRVRGGTLIGPDVRVRAERVLESSGLL